MGQGRGAYRRRLVMLALLASTSLGSALFCPGSAHAQDATWRLNPGSGDFNTGANWTPAAVPTGTAFFDATSQSAITVGAATTLGGLTFNASAPAYTITIAPAGSLTFAGAGIVNNSGQAQTLVNQNILAFTNNSTAGNATIVTNIGATTDFSASTGPLGDNRLSAGSIAGAGSYVLGANELTVGSDGSSTLVSGTISGVGGSLVKTGAGTLALQNNSTYSGDTLVQAGRLVASSSTAFSASSNYTVAAGATLEVSDISGIIATVGSLSGAGNVEIGNGATLAAGFNAVTAIFSGVLSGNGSLSHEGPGIQVLTGAGSSIGGDLTLLTPCGCVAGQLVLRGGDLAVGGYIDVEAGTLIVEQGAKLTGAASLIVFGALQITGAGSAVTIANDTVVAGSLTIEQGGQLDAGSGTTTLAGTVLVSGAGSALTAATLLVQNLGFPTSLTIAAGGSVTSGGAAITGFAGPVTVLVTGAGSTWTVGGGGLSIGPGALEATSVTLADGGALLLTSGDLQIAELGTLNIGNGGRAGTLTIAAGAILLDGRIVADFTDSVTIANDILANVTPGSLTKRGTGTLTLTGTNTFTGGTVLEGGTLSVSSEANLGDVSGALTLNGGVLQVIGTSFTQSARPIIFGAAGGGFDIADAANTFTVTQSFSGPGSLSKLGAGTLLLTGAQSYSGATIVAGGTLLAGTVGAFSPNSAFSLGAGATLALNSFNQTIGSLAGAGAVALGTATLTMGGNNASTLFSGAISGTGGLVKAGTGALTLTGTSSLTGPTSLQSGLLTVNGSIAGSVVTINGGTLGGSGFVGGINALAGTVAPGNSIGTLSVAGNVAFAAGSTYQVELNAAGASDLVAATGTATLSGGQVQLLAAPGSYGLSTRYVILSAQGGVSGQFSGVATNFAFLTPTLTYDAREVALTLERNALTFPDAAVTRNQASAGRAAEALGTGNRVYDALVSSTIAEARIGFDALSGEAHAQAVSVAIETSHLVRDTIMNRLRAPFLSSSSGTVTGTFSADAPGRPRMAALPAPGFETRRFQLWGEAIGAQGRSDGDGNAASLDRRGGGMLFGAELDSGGGETLWRVGVAGGFTHSRFDIDQRRSDGTQDAVHAALYGGARVGAVNLRAGAAYAWNQTKLTRLVGLNGFSDVLRFDGQGATVQAFAEVGYALPLGSVAFEPFVQVAAVSVHSDSGTEQGGAAALRLNGRDQNLGFSIVGLRAETQLGATPLFARAMLGWRHAFGETTPTAVLAFAGAAPPSGSTPRRWRATRWLRRSGCPGASPAMSRWVSAIMPPWAMARATKRYEAGST